MYNLKSISVAHSTPQPVPVATCALMHPHAYETREALANDFFPTSPSAFIELLH